MSGQDKRGSFFYTLLGYLAILVILLVIALTIGASLYWFVILPGRIPARDAFAKWSGLAIFTLGTFGFVVKKSRTRWRSRAFWIILGAILAVHITVFLVIFRYVEPWREWYLLIVCTVEAPSIMTVLHWSFERFGKKHHLKGV